MSRSFYWSSALIFFVLSLFSGCAFVHDVKGDTSYDVPSGFTRVINLENFKKYVAGRLIENGPNFLTLYSDHTENFGEVNFFKDGVIVAPEIEIGKAYFIGWRFKKGKLCEQWDEVSLNLFKDDSEPDCRKVFHNKTTNQVVLSPLPVTTSNGTLRKTPSSQPWYVGSRFTKKELKAPWHEGGNVLYFKYFKGREFKPLNRYYLDLDTLTSSTSPIK